MQHNHNRFFVIRYLICVLILIISGTALYYLSLYFIAQIYRHQAKNYFHEKSYALAASCLEKAVHYQPKDHIIYKELGNAYFKQSIKPKAKNKYIFLEKAKRAYLKAVKLNSLDAQGYYGLARTEFRLDKIYKSRNPEKKNTPYHPLIFFKQAVYLKPNSIKYNFGMLRYFAYNKQQDKMLPVVRIMAQNYPGIYHYLKKEKFWSPLLRLAYIKGLEQAVENKIYIRESYMIMAELMAEDKNWDNAVINYEKGLAYKRFQNNEDHYIRLAFFYLKNKQIDKAEKNFLKSLNMSKARENKIQYIYRLYKQDDNLKIFYYFLRKLKKQFNFSYHTDILAAQVLFDLKQYENAKKVLVNINKNNPNAQAYYWLYRIGEQQKNFDDMELNIQKATIYDFQNSHYHLIFSHVLNRLRKYEGAENSASLAIKYHKKPPFHFFNHRAWIRWQRKNFQGAVEDWKQAVKLKPDNALLYAYIANAYKYIKDYITAQKYYKKALNLAPNNVQYQKAYNDVCNLSLQIHK